MTFNPDALAAAGKRWFCKPPAGYSSPSAGAISDFSYFASVIHKSPLAPKLIQALSMYHGKDLIIRLTHMFQVQRWLMQNGPTFFVDPDILTACENTDALGCVTGSDIKVVYPCGYFCLPKDRGFVSKITGDSVRHIWFNFVDRDQEVELNINGHRSTPKTEGEIPLVADSRKILMLAYWEKSKDSSSFNLPLDISDQPLIKTLEQYRHLISVGPTTDRQLSQSELERDTEDFGLWVGSLVVNLCLLMQSYPQYLQGLPLQASERQHFKDAVPPQSILIRRSTKHNLQQIVAHKNAEDIQPSERELSPHWRRGHWRRQPHGDRWELENPEVKIIILEDNRHYHMKWLEPVFIGLK